ncbi:MAG: glutaredoxin family protein [Candidatus Porifericomitaceae bacterium WSBS_2022_MAG_OTU9]
MPLAIGGALAKSIVECRDENGQVYFADKCPESTKFIAERKIAVKNDGSADMQRLQKESPVVLYVTDACDACDLMRNYLQRHGAPFTEKSVATDAANQTELKEKSGLLQVPVVYVGEQAVNGVNRGALKNALDSAGYPDTSQPEAEAEAEPQR